MKNWLFSLCAITPLLLRGEDMIHASKHTDDFFSSSFLEEAEVTNDQTEREPVSLEVIDLTDLQVESESKDNLADAQTKQTLEEVPSDEPAASRSKENMCQDQTMCMPDIQPYQINVRHTERKGIGYNRGYTTLEGFFTDSRGKYIPFLDLRGHVFDNGKLAANAGIGVRYIMNPNKSMWGINAYYDYRNLKHAHFNQVGAGLEGFHNRWELRLNGYLPVGTKSVVSNHHLNGITFKAFQGNNLLINENYTDKIISAKKGGDLEIGVHPFKIMRDYDCLVAAGPYYFGGEGASSWGGKARIKVEVAKYFFVELSDSYDKVFHNRFQGTLMVSLPFGRKKCYPKKARNAPTNDCFANNIMAWRGVQPVQRQEIIVTKKETKSYIIDPIAINPTTKQPIFITFVNNNNTTSAGDGTFENPFSSLANAQANTGEGSVIYVFGTGTAYTHGWALQDFQRFLGSAAQHNFNTTLGTVTVPIQTSLFPLLTTNGITHGSQMFTNLEISGVSIQQVGGFPALNIGAQMITVTNNLFLGAASTVPTVVISCSGNALVDSNIVIGAGGATTTNGISFSPFGTNTYVTATVTNNLSFLNGQGIVIGSNANGGTLNVLVSGNTCSQNTMGINFAGGNTPTMLIATVNANTVYNNTGNGVQFFNQKNCKLNVFGNTTISNGGSGIDFESAITGQTYCVSLNNNVSYLNTSTDYSFIAPSGSTIFTEPFVNNVGNFNMTGAAAGTIVPVPACSCHFCSNND